MEGESPFRRHVAWGLCCAAYLVASPYFERLNNPNENVRVWATRAIVAHHVLNIDDVQREWGWVNDKAKNERHVYSGKAPGASFAGVPVLWVQTKLRQLVGWAPPGKREATFWLRLFVVKLPLCAFLLLFARYAGRVTGSAWARDAAVVALGMGTLMYPYGNMFVGHALAAAAAFSAFILLDEAEEDAPMGTLKGFPNPPTTGSGEQSSPAPNAIPARTLIARMLLAGLLAGLAVLFEYQALLVSIVLAGYAAVRNRRHLSALAAFVAGAMPPAFALGVYHTVLFGRPWRFPYANIENAAFAKTDHAAGFFGLTLPHWSAFPSSLWSPSYGLFAFSPVLALGVVAIGVLFARGSRSERRDAALAATVSVVLFFFLAGMTHWRAGWCVGPRYITTIAPFLLLPLLKLWPRLGGRWRWWATALAVGLLIPSLVLNQVSGALYPHYPEAYDNPVFDLAFPLIADGYAPYGLGWLVHLPGRWSLAPLAIVGLAAVSLVAAGDDPRPRRTAAHLALALGIAAVFLLGLSAYGREPRPSEAHADAVVHQAWEPPRR